MTDTEHNKTGFTVTDLMNTLKWTEEERFYLQNTMSLLTRKGVSKKLGPQKPVVYSFKKASKGVESGKAATKRQAQKAAAVPVVKKSQPQPTVEDVARMEISPELAGQGVLYLIAQLKEKNEELNTEIAAVKQQLADAAAKIDAQSSTIKEQSDTIKEKAATIETQEQAIANLKRDYKLLAKIKSSPIIEKKKATAAAKAR